MRVLTGRVGRLVPPVILLAFAATTALADPQGSAVKRGSAMTAFALPEYKLDAALVTATRLALRRPALQEAEVLQPEVVQAPARTVQPARVVQIPNQKYTRLINEAARLTALDPALVHAVIAVESGYNAAARSPKGAIGLMQVMPATASRYGVPDPATSPEANLRAGTRYLRYLMELFENRIELVLAAYNAGENAVLRHGSRIPPFRETQLYVPAVLARYRLWQTPTPTPISMPRAQKPLPPPAAQPSRIQYMSGTGLKPGVMDYIIRHTMDAQSSNAF